MKFQELVEMLTERRGKTYPTAPLHSEGVEVSGYSYPQIYVGWKISSNHNNCIVMMHEYKMFVASEKSELPNMVKDLTKFLETIDGVLEEQGSNGDENEERLGDIGCLCLYHKILEDLGQDDSCNVITLMEKRLYSTTPRLVFTGIVIGLPIGGTGNRIMDIQNQLAIKRDELLQEVSDDPGKGTI